jgi:DNA-binding response OmpR family regulator
MRVNVVTQRQLVNKVWGAGYEDVSRLLHVNISNLRHCEKSSPILNSLDTFLRTWELGIECEIANLILVGV